MPKFTLAMLLVTATMALNAGQVQAQVYTWTNLVPAVNGNLSTATPTISFRFSYDFVNGTRPTGYLVQVYDNSDPVNPTSMNYVVTSTTTTSGTAGSYAYVDVTTTGTMTRILAGSKPGKISVKAFGTYPQILSSKEWVVSLKP